MRVEVLFGEGKDYGLKAILFEPFGSEMGLDNFALSKDEACQVARSGAGTKALGHPQRVALIDEEIPKKALSELKSDGFQNGALDCIHALAMECPARESDQVADGTRRKDRSPVMRRREIQSLEDRLHVNCLWPLAGAKKVGHPNTRSAKSCREDITQEPHPYQSPTEKDRCPRN